MRRWKISKLGGSIDDSGRELRPKNQKALGYPKAPRANVVQRLKTLEASICEPFLSWEKKKFVRVLLFTGEKRAERIPEVPTLREIFNKEKVPENSRRVAEVILAAESFGRPIVTGPGTPADRIKILREAFNKAIKDSELLGETQKQTMDVEPEIGENLEKLANRILEQPPDVIARVKKILGG